MGNFLTNYFKDPFDDKAHAVYLRTDELQIHSAAKALGKYGLKAAFGELAAEGAGKVMHFIAKNGGTFKSTLYIQAENIVIKPTQETRLVFSNTETIQIPYKDIVEIKKSKVNWLYDNLILSTVNGNVTLMVSNSLMPLICNQLLKAKESAGY